MDHFTDQQTPLAVLKETVKEFVTERKWEPYHTPKNLAISISLESAELLEHFQWYHPEAGDIEPREKEKIAEEMADVLAYLLSLSNVLDIDLAAVFQRKMRKNRGKYPADRFQGTWEKVRDHEP